VRPTRNGWIALMSGAALYVAGAVLGYPELVVGGAGLVLLVGVSFLWVLRVPLVSVERVVESTRVRRGDPVVAILRVTSSHPPRSPRVEILDRLGARTVTLLIPSLPVGGSHVTTYELPTSRRGPHALGPLVISRSDPIGLVARRRTEGDEAIVLVRPRALWMAEDQASGAVDVDGASRENLPEGGISFQSLRPYTIGDDLRLIHWRTTARTGTLMVKRQVDVERPEVWLLLDDRLSSYRAADSFEDAVDVAASAVATAARLQRPVRLETVSGQLHASSAKEPDDALDALAAVQALPTGVGTGLDAVFGGLDQQARGEQALFVGGDRMGDDLSELHRRLGRRFRRVTALIIAAFREPEARVTGGLSVYRAPTATALVSLWNGGADGPVPGSRRAGRPASPRTPARTAGDVDPWLLAIHVAAALMAVATAGLAFQRVFSLRSTIVPVVLGVALGGAAGVAAALKVRKPEGQVLVTAGAVIAAGTATALRSTPPPSGLGAATNYGLTWMSAWGHVLSTSPPMPPTPDRLPLVGAIVALAAALASMTAARRRPGLRPLLPATLLFLAGLTLGIGGPGSLVAVTFPFLGGAAIYLACLSVGSPAGAERTPPARWAAATLTVSAVLVVVLGAGNRLPLADAHGPLDLSRLLHRTVAIGAVSNPLDQLSPPPSASAGVAFTAHVDGAWLAEPANWRLVTLDRFSGSGWTWSAAPVRAGGTLPVPASAGGTRAVADLSVGGLTGPWVPTTGIPAGVHPSNLGYDPVSQVLVDPPSVQGHRYQLQVLLPLLSGPKLGTLAVDHSAGGLTVLPACVPPQVHSVAAAITGAVGPYAQAVALAHALATGFTLDPAAPPGYSCDELARFVQAKRGNAAQFATTYAVMARSVGLPARVAVGFGPGAIDAATGEVTVQSSNATAWPEVAFAGVGWVPFDPLPASGPGGAGGIVAAGAARASTSGAPGARASGPSTHSAPSAPVQQPAALAPTPTTAATTPPTTAPTTSAAAPPTTIARSHGHHAGPPGGWWTLVAIVVLLVMVQIVSKVGLPRRRRRLARQRRTDPTARALGAWEEVLDRLAAFSVPVGTMTPAEITAAATRLAPTSSAAMSQLAAMVDCAVYGGAQVTPAGARQAWQESGEAIRALRQAQPPGRRLRGAVRPGRPRPLALRT
jgi:uncharacterized protein (DUF58 family)/transglutaminase-like putative cysteine protease